MPDIWVDPLFGLDTNNGTSPASAKASFAAGYAAVTVNNTLWLMTGNYIDQISAFSLNKTGVTIRASGVVRIIASAGGGVVSGFLANNVNTKLYGLRMEGYVTYFSGPGTLRLKGCTLSGSNSGAAFLCAVGTLQLHLENNTFRNLTTIFSASNTTINVQWARNNIYDGYTNYKAGAGPFALVNSNYNAHSAAAGMAGNTPTEANSLYSVASPGYRDAAAVPPDLSIDPNSGSALIGAGDFGTNIGAWFWPTMISGTDTRVIATDWSNWSNDELWYNTSLVQVGIEGPANASPAILLPTEPRMWIIDPTRGLQGAARIIGPVWDFGKVVDFRQVSWKAEELMPSKVVHLTTTYGTPALNTKDIGLRASNSPFARTDASPAWGFQVSKTTDFVNGMTGRYWQPRVVLRTDASQI